MTELFDLLEPKTQKKFKALWKEADEGQTREAQLLKQLDKFEMLLQASEYEIEKNYKKPVFDVFLEYNKPFITQPVLKQLLEEIEKTTH